MKSYGDKSFEDRASQAAQAKQKALDQLRSKPPIDPTIVAARQAAGLKREADQSEKRAARKAAEQATKDARAADAAAKSAAVKPDVTEQDRKRARDARYAARKSRK